VGDDGAEGEARVWSGVEVGWVLAWLVWRGTREGERGEVPRLGARAPVQSYLVVD
jgi:hypothetical protein